MLLYFKIRKSIFLVVTIIFSKLLSHAQAPSFAAPAPNTGQTSHSVSQYSGGLSVGIPLATIAGEYASVPVSLSYTAGNGVKVNQLSSAVGLGWNLNAGGMISRQVNDLPDDCKTIINGRDVNGDDIVAHDNVGYLYRLGASNPIDGLVAKDLTALTSTDIHHVFAATVDKEPDLFSFNFNGYSGTFVFDKNGVIKTHTKQDLIITYHLSGDLSPSNEYPEVFPNHSLFKGAIISFTIITPDGFKYNFSKKEVVISKEYSQSSENFNEASTDCNPKIKDPYLVELENANATFAAWHLTSMISPIGDFYNASFLYKNELYMDHSNIRQTCIRSTVIDLPGVNAPCQNKLETKFSASANIYIKPRLATIETINGRLVFDYDEPYSNRFDIVNNLHSIIDNNRTTYFGSNKLGNIKLFNKDNNLLKTIHFNYDLSSSNMPCNNHPHQYRHKLLEIKEIYSGNDISLVKFGYDETPLPPRHSAQIDNWGYYNGSGATSFLKAAKAYPNDANNSDHNTIYSTYPRTNGGTAIELSGDAGIPNFTYTKAGILTNMTNAIGGTTIFEYESNSFLAVGCSTPQLGAGVRIKTITLDDKNGHQNATNYFYDENGNGTGTTTGRLVEAPILHRLTNASDYYYSGRGRYCQGSQYALNDANQDYLHYTYCMAESCPLPTVLADKINKLTTYYSPNYWSSSATSGYVVPVGYKKVTAQTINGRVESIFNLENYQGSSETTNYWNHSEVYKPATSQWRNGPEYKDNYPYPSNPNYDWSRSLLLSQTTYNAAGEKVLTVENTYQLFSHSKVNALKTYLSVYNREYRNSDLTMFNWGKYYHSIVDVRLKKVTTTEWSDVNNAMISETNYEYGSNHAYPISVKTKNSDNIEYETKSYYPADEQEVTLVSLHRVAQPIRTETYVNGSKIGGAKTIFSATTFSEYHPETCNGCADGYTSYFDIYLPKYQQVWENNAWKTVKTIQTIDERGKVLSELDNIKNLVTKYEYNAVNLLIAKTVHKALLPETSGFKEQYAYDNLRRLQSTTHPDGQSTTYTYDAFHRISEVSSRGGAMKTKNEYGIDPTNLANNFVKSYSLYGMDQTPVSVKYTDAVGRPIRSVIENYTPNHNDFVSTTTYDDENARVLTQTPISQYASVTEYEKSPLQRVLSARAGGWLQKPTSAYLFNNSIDVPGYEANTLYKTQVTDENGGIVQEFKDKMGRLILSRRIIDPNMVYPPTELRYWYSLEGQLLKVGDPVLVSLAPDLLYYYTYYPNGQLQTKTIPQKGTYTYTYDANYRMDTETLPDGTILQYTYNDYDQQAAVWNSTNSADKFKLHEFEYYSDNNNTTKKRLHKKKTLILGSNPRIYLETSYVYDNFGRTAQETVQHHKNGSDTYIYTYDARDRMSTVTRTHTNGSTTTILAKRFDYDHANRLKAVYLKRNTDAEIQLNGMDYNEKDQLVRKKLGVSATGIALQNLNYAYNERGWLTGINTIAQGYCPCAVAQASLYSIDNALAYQGIVKMNYETELAADLSENVILKVQLENNGYLNGVQQTFDEKTFDILLGNADIDSDWALQDMINVYGVANLGTIANALSMAMKTKIEATTDEPLQNAKRFELIEKLRKYSDCNPTFDNELFAMELHYNDGKSDLDAPAQYNGNISWMKWRVNTGNTRLSQAYGYQYDKLNRLTKATYGEFELDKPCVINKDRYNETISYQDHRGNIDRIQRNGLFGNATYGEIDNIGMMYTGNKLNTITESGDLTKGFKGSNGNVTYDNRGNMIQDASRGLNVSYNFLDLPTLIQNSMGQIEFIYDASGNLLTKTVTYNGSRGAPPTTTDYVKGIEYVNDVMTSIYHDEGRLVQVNGTWQSEYVIKDHLGNARVTFRDVDGNGFITASDITQEAHYYPFGMQMEGTWTPAAAVRIPYLYNGIEHVSDLGLDINTALYRTLDPALGRWWQIDPKAEAVMGLSPYNAMNNNPVLLNDPKGDIVWFAPVIIGAIVGAYAGASVQSNSWNFTEWKSDAWKGAIVGAFVGASIGAMGAAAGGATGIKSAAGVVSKAWGITTTGIQGANINMLISAVSGGNLDNVYKSGIAGAVSSLYAATGGFGLAKAGNLGRHASEMLGSAIQSVGQNWANGDDPFSQIRIPVGPVNLTLGQGQRLIQWENNIGNMITNSVGLANWAFAKGHIAFDKDSWSPVYTKGFLEKFGGAWGAHAIMGPHSHTISSLSHEGHHIWQSRVLGDRFLPFYGGQAMLGAILGKSMMAGAAELNFFESLPYYHIWWK
jgi:RHS repeat-associated protein